MLDYASLLRRFMVPVTGVLHVGGYIGGEDDTYRAMGFRHRLFVEAQPDTFAVLRTRLEGSGALCENVAISDREGMARFHVLDNGASSSLLAPKAHLRVYPTIREVREIDVPTTTIDALLARPPYAGLTFNFINIDIQGAELLAFRGAERTLASVDAINAELNFDELYEGAPHVRELDAFLGLHGFVRVDTVSAHYTWGDGFYVKDRLTRA